MNQYSAGEIVLLRFVSAAGTVAKVRPALVMLDTGDIDLIVAKITSHAPRSKYDIEIRSWRSAGLALPSVVRINKLGTFEKAEIRRTLGRAGKEDWRIIQSAFRKMWE